MNVKQYIAVVLCAATSLQTAAAAALPSYTPFSRWNVDYSDDSCALRRGFRSGKTDIYLELRQFSPGNPFTITVVSPAIHLTDQPLKARFDPKEDFHTPPDAQYLRYPKFYGAYSWRDSLFPLPKNDKIDFLTQPNDTERLHREKLVTNIEIAGIMSPGIRLETGAMDQPLSAMRTCMDELLTHWGIDAGVQRTLITRAKAVDQRTWAKIIQDYYPEKMLLDHQDGIVRVRVIVGADGLPKSCHIQIPSQDRSFEEAACDGMMKASKFSPALDTNGMPVDSYFVTTIFYKIN